MIGDLLLYLDKHFLLPPLRLIRLGVISTLVLICLSRGYHLLFSVLVLLIIVIAIILPVVSIGYLTL